MCEYTKYSLHGYSPLTPETIPAFLTGVFNHQSRRMDGKFKRSSWVLGSLPRSTWVSSKRLSRRSKALSCIINRFNNIKPKRSQWSRRLSSNIRYHVFTAYPDQRKRTNHKMSNIMAKQSHIPPIFYSFFFHEKEILQSYYTSLCTSTCSTCLFASFFSHYCFNIYFIAAT